MKLSQAIETQYRGNLMFHTQDDTVSQARSADVYIRTCEQVESSFDATFDIGFAPRPVPWPQGSWTGPEGDAWIADGGTKD